MLGATSTCQRRHPSTQTHAVYMYAVSYRGECMCRRLPCKIHSVLCNGCNSQCYQPYTTLTDTWRATSNGGSHANLHMGDVALDSSHCATGNSLATGVGGGSWYRFEGVGGDALPLEPPNGNNHCGTAYSGWLTGWVHLHLSQQIDTNDHHLHLLPGRC